MLQRLAQAADLAEHAAAWAHGAGPQRRRPVHGLLTTVVHGREARIDVFLPAEPLLHAVGHADNREHSHFIGGEPDGLARLGAVALDLQAAVGSQLARQQFLHKLGTAHGAEQIDQMLGLLPDQALELLTLVAGIELDQIDKGIAIDTVQQAQLAHLPGLLPQRQRARHTCQMVAKSAGLVPILAHTALQHHRQQRRQIGVTAQPFLVQQGLGAFEQHLIQLIPGLIHALTMQLCRHP